MHGYCSSCIPYFINFTFCAFFLSCPSIPLFANRDSKEEEHKPPTIINSAPPNNQAKQKSSQIQTKIKPNKNQHKPTWFAAQTHTGSPLLLPLDFPCCRCRFPLLPPLDPLPCVNVGFEIDAVLGSEFRWNRSAACLDRNFREEFGIERSSREEWVCWNRNEFQKGVCLVSGEREFDIK